eukprot:10784614-Ditylum_brightwellii.AAC.1
MIIDMRCFNTHGNNNTSLMQFFWDKAAEVIEKENGSGAHFWQHASAFNKTTNGVLLAPGFVSIPQLDRKMFMALEEEILVEGKDYKVP